MFEKLTPESIKNEILESLSGKIDTQEGSFANDMASPVSLAMWKIYASLDAIVSVFFPDENSGEFIDTWCSYHNIFRKTGTKAEVMLTITGANGKVVPKGTAFLNAESFSFLTAEDVKIIDGQASVLAVASETGMKYNVGSGEIDHPMVSVPGVTAVTNSAAATGGSDPESDASLLKRLYARLQEPPTSGNINHYRQWALECEGVGEARVVSLWNGPGTVKVLITSEDKSPVDEVIIANTFAHIESLRPVGAAVTVSTVENLDINITAEVSIDESTTLEKVTAEFNEAIDAYLKEISLVQYTVPYIRIGYLLAGVDGVLDYSNLTINGDVANIAVGAEQVPKRGAVTLSEST